MIKERVSIVCSEKPEIVPIGATVAKCSTCMKEIIYDKVGLEKVKATHRELEVQLNCWDCMEIILQEENFSFRGWARDLQ